MNKLLEILFVVGTVSTSTWTPPISVNVGVMGPQFDMSGEIKNDGLHALSAVLMAVREINDKTDRVGDDILPSTVIKLALRTPRIDYIEATTAALELSNNVFNGEGILGLVGASSTETSKAIAEIFSHTNYKVPQISYGATSSDFGHAIKYGYSARTCPSDAYQGQVLAQIIKLYFNWHVATVFASGDTFGNDVSLEFEEEANRLDIHIESKSSFRTGVEDFTSIITDVMQNGGVLKVFVLLMKAHDAGRLLEQGYKLGLFKEGVQIFVTDYGASTDTWSVMTPEADVERIMRGVIGISPSLASERGTPTALDFIRRFRSQKSTMYTNSDGQLICDDTLDDDGHTHFFKGHADGKSSSKLTCAGIDYSLLSEDGSDIKDSAFYAYDAMYAMAKALHVLYYDKKIKNITGDDLKWAIINDVQFLGASSEISFSRGGEGSDAYGQGDRATPVDYTIYNFDPRQYHEFIDNGAEAWTYIGEWTPQNELHFCDKRYHKQCSEWIFNTEDGKEPIDEAPVVYIQMNQDSRIGLRVGGSICLAVILFFLLVVELCKDTRLIKISQPVLMKMVLVGALLACIRVLLITVDLNDVNCVVGKWLGHLAFALTFGALILKIWRVDAVINSGFKRVTVTSAHVQHLLFGGLVLFCLYLLADTLYSRPHQSYEESFDGHHIIRRVKCSNRFYDMTTVLFVIEGLMLVAGARLCWTTRSAPGAVNDSTYIAMTMYLILFVSAVLFPIVYIKIEPDPATLLTITATGFLLTTLGGGLLLFGPKTLLLLEGADVNDSFEVIKKASESDDHSSSNNLQYLKNRAVSKVNQKMSKISKMSRLSCNSEDHMDNESKAGSNSNKFRNREVIKSVGSEKSEHKSIDSASCPGKRCAGRGASLKQSPSQLAIISESTGRKEFLKDDDHELDEQMDNTPLPSPLTLPISSPSGKISIFSKRHSTLTIHETNLGSPSTPANSYNISDLNDGRPTFSPNLRKKEEASDKDGKLIT